METRNRQTSRGWGWRKTRPTLAVIRPEGTVAYIGGSDTLPAPLTREEEQTLFARMMREPDAARQTLIEQTFGWWFTSRESLRTRASALRI